MQRLSLNTGSFLFNAEASAPWLNDQALQAWASQFTDISTEAPLVDIFEPDPVMKWTYTYGNIGPNETQRARGSFSRSLSFSSIRETMVDGVKKFIIPIRVGEVVGGVFGRIVIDAAHSISDNLSLAEGAIREVATLFGLAEDDLDTRLVRAALLDGAIDPKAGEQLPSVIDAPTNQEGTGRSAQVRHLGAERLAREIERLGFDPTIETLVDSILTWTARHIEAVREGLWNPDLEKGIRNRVGALDYDEVKFLYKIIDTYEPLECLLLMNRLSVLPIRVGMVLRDKLNALHAATAETATVASSAYSLASSVVQVNANQGDRLFEIAASFKASLNGKPQAIVAFFTALSTVPSGHLKIAERLGIIKISP